MKRQQQQQQQQVARFGRGLGNNDQGRRYLQQFKVMFCRVCGFRVRVWESYRTSTSFGYGYESVTELPEVPGIAARAYRTYRSSGRVQKVLHPYPGYCGTGCTELTEVPGTDMNVLQN